MTRHIKSSKTIAAPNASTGRQVKLEVEVAGLKQSLNAMVDQLNDFAKEVTRTAREVGDQRGNGDHFQAPAMSGAWKHLAGNVNLMSANIADKGQSAFNVFVVHEDTLTGVRAAAVLGRLADFLDNEPVMQNEIWKFDSLSHPSLYEQALSQAAKAEMIIVSAAGTRSLPPHIAELIADALGRKNGRSAAVVALLDLGRSSAEPSPLCGELRQMAEKAGVDFFCNTGESYWAAETAPGGPSLMANGILNFW